jgi:hypothetical protein
MTDALVIGGVALVPQFGIHPRASVGLATELVDPFNLDEQFPISSRAY